MIDEGYTKYECDWREAPALPEEAVAELNAWRNRLHEQGLIGYYPQHGVGFGNVSIREGDTDAFLISGTQTGDIARTDERHYARVTRCDIEANKVHCEGPVQASSEALTHAAIYALDPAIRAVVHVHSVAMWNKLIDTFPFGQQGVAIMGGHEEGIVSFGRDVGQATERVLQHQD
jgi:ribulose-5-phosphate 4-epimerase/fuculose-1-phosphate aldolase